MPDPVHTFPHRPEIFGNDGEPEFTEDGKAQNLTWCRICGGKCYASESLFGQTIGHQRCRDYVAARVKACAEVVERQTIERIVEHGRARAQNHADELRFPQASAVAGFTNWIENPT